jgi:hypothetical protein
METPSQSADSRPSQASHAAAQRWAERFVAAWRPPTDPVAFAADVGALLSEDVRLLGPMMPTTSGLAAFEHSFVKPIFGLIPDAHAELESWAASERTLFVELTVHGTIGRHPLSFRVCDRLTLREGIAVERQSYFDPTPIALAVIRSPSAWPRLLRLRLSALLVRLRS